MPTVRTFFDPFGAFAPEGEARVETKTKPPALSYPSLLGELFRHDAIFPSLE